MMDLLITVLVVLVAVYGAMFAVFLGCAMIFAAKGVRGERRL